MRKINKYFVKNSVGVLKKVLMCPPTYTLIKRKSGNHKITIDRDICCKEHNELVDAYRSNGVEVVLIDPDEKLNDQVFSRDFGACIKEGYILGSFRNDGRMGETVVYKKEMEKLEVPCVARCTVGVFEGGDFWILDDKTIAIGVFERTNETGVAEIARQLREYGYNVVSVPSLEKCLHLDMCFNMISEKLAVACTEVLPDSFLKTLKDRKFQIIEVDRSKLLECCCNIQTLGNDRVISFKNNRLVNEKLRSNGIDVIEVNINEIFKHGGGIHCMTFPLSRS